MQHAGGSFHFFISWIQRIGQRLYRSTSAHPKVHCENLSCRHQDGNVGRHVIWNLGAGGSMSFIKLSDGRIIARKNDLWDDRSMASDDYGWSRSVPSGALWVCPSEQECVAPSLSKHFI